MARKSSLTPSAYLLLGVTCFLVVGGILMIYSASSVSDYVKYGDSAYHLKKQLIFGGVGALVLYLFSHWEFRHGRKRRGTVRLHPGMVAWGLWGVSLFGLILVQAMGVGKWGATRSIELGPVYIQPSEFAKLGCILVVAFLLVQWRRKEIGWKVLLQRLGVVLGPMVLLIMLQPDMGTTMSLLFSVALLLWLGGVRGRWLGLTVLAGTPLAALMVLIAGYRMERVTSFINPWADPSDTGYQIIQSLYAFGSGGLFGVGSGLSRQKFFYLPAAHTDFIFAVIGEELGLVGTLAVVIAFALFAYAGTRIALECKDPFGRLLAGGLTAMIVVQALMNMAAVTGLMPITGIPLPFVSAGGSSLTLTLACVGLILAVSRNSGGARVRLVRPTKTRGSERANTVEWRRDGRPHLPRADGGRSTGRRGA
ncbi:MAG: putative lipid II flippase FtsW [Coriobacteriia bacterium]|nr:putative lipid II flippase FtsW [Coriobacteriia bacterium]